MSPPSAVSADSTPGAWRAIIIASLGGVFEFYDLMMTAYIAPALFKAGVFHKIGLFGQNDQAVFAAATFLGLFAGTLVFSRLADRFGRRAIFTASLVWYAAFTAAMAFAQDAGQLCVLRLISGLGIGVELVTIDAYVAEMAPAKSRGAAFALSQAIQFCAVPLVAFACWRLTPLQPLGWDGWRWVMLAGASGALVVWFLRRGLPETPRWLAARSVEEAPLAEIFRPPLRSRTWMLTVFNIAQAVGFYGFGNWVPSLVAARGHAVTASLGYSFAIALAFPLGPLLCAWTADRFERRTQIIAAALTTATLGLVFATQSAPAVLIALGIGVTFSNNLLSFSYHAYQSELFPTRLRGKAVGFVYAWSRLSTALVGFVIAGLLGRWGAGAVFGFIAAAMAVVIIAVGAFGPRTSGAALEDLAT